MINDTIQKWKSWQIVVAARLAIAATTFLATCLATRLYVLLQSLHGTPAMNANVATAFLLHVARVIRARCIAVLYHYSNVFWPSP
jgi:hypothetical protein